MIRRWLIRALLRMLDRDLARHAAGCRICKKIDLENCDEKQFCRAGRVLFNRSFDFNQLMA